MIRHEIDAFPLSALFLLFLQVGKGKGLHVLGAARKIKTLITVNLYCLIRSRIGCMVWVSRLQWRLDYFTPVCRGFLNPWL